MANLRHSILTAPALAAALALAPAPVAADAFGEGLAAYDGGAYAEAARIWRPLEKSGDLDAMGALAGLYYQGLGVAPDAGRAAALYKRAAEGGSPIAQMNFGEMLAKGVGVDRDRAAGWAWLTMAGRAGRKWAARAADRLRKSMDSDERARGRMLARQIRENIAPQPQTNQTPD